jgi:hypothetical protein
MPREILAKQHAYGALHELVACMLILFLSTGGSSSSLLLAISSLKPEFCIASVLNVMIDRESSDRVFRNTHAF